MMRWVHSAWAGRGMATLALAGLLTAWMTVRGAESPEAREIKARLKAQAERVRNLEVAYRLEAKTGLEPRQLPTMASFRNLLFLRQEQWQEAFKGEKRFKRLIQPEKVTYLAPVDAHGLVPPDDPSPGDPPAIRENQRRLKESYDRAVAAYKAQEARGVKLPRRDPSIRDPMERDVTRAFNGRTLWMRRPRSAAVDEYMIWPTSREAMWFQVSDYLGPAGLHLPDPTMKNPAVLRAQSMIQVSQQVIRQSYALEERTEVIGGSTCVVLKGSPNSLFQPSLLVGETTDRIWLDRDHGLALRRREMSRDGRLEQRWENSDLREVEPGLWLPFSIRHDQFAADAPAVWKDKPVLTEEIRVDRLQLNQVKDDLFDMVPKKSDHIEDLRGVL